MKNKLIRKVSLIEFKKKIDALCLIIVLLFSLLNFSFFSVLPYSNEQYNTSEWINENTPTDSIFLLHPYFENFIKGMTLRDTTENCSKLFDLNLNSSERSKSFFLLNNSDFRFSNHSKGYLSLDMNYINRLKMEILWIGEPCVGNGEECVPLNVLYNELYNSDLFKLVYNQTNILIYEINII
ncbi:hypothetical protein DSAG12_04150 [Promethearchaeum syntrophicum]|nr:hypothetical protein [Candidatus Prometheoarchaeum syntrophicum]